MFLSLALIVFVNILISRSFMDPDYLSSLEGITSLFEQLIAFFFPAGWIANSYFPGAGFLYLLLALGLYGFAAGLMILVTRSTYLQDVSNRIVVSRKKVKRVKVSAAIKKQGIIRALISKELHVLFSNSTFIFQTVGELCIFPILLVLFMFILPGNYYRELAALLPTGQVLSLLIFGLCVALTCINSLSSTSLSREGKTFALSLVIPVPGTTHMISKLTLYILFYFPVFMIDMIILMFFLTPDFLSLVYMIPGALVFLIFAFIINIAIDLQRPVLKWTHPMQAVKNNLNVLIGLGISFGYLAILGISGWAMLEYLGLPPLVFGCGLVFLIGIVDILLLPLLFRFAEKRYNGGIEME
jgi:ABC-2 type transport system permease protein